MPRNRKPRPEPDSRAARRALPLKDRLARAKALADAMGPNDPDFDMKAYTDEMWNDA